MKKLIITEEQYKLIKENDDPFDTEDLQNLKRLLLSGDWQNINIVFAILEGYPDILDKLIDEALGSLIYLGYISGFLRQKYRYPDRFQIQQLFELWGMDLSNKNIHNIPENIGYLRNLTFLSFNDNRIKTLPKSLEMLQSLERLDLNGNPIPISDVEVLKRNLPNCKIYF